MDWVNALAKISNKVKFQLFGRTYENLLHLYAQVPKYDPERKGGLSEHAFNLLLNACGIFLSTQEIRIIKDNFPHECGVNYFLFISSVRGDITQKRVAAIDHTFFQFQNNGCASLAELLKAIQIKKHPHVRSLMKNADKAQIDLESALQYWSKDSQNLTHEEWTQFGKDVNACVPLEREQFFIDLLVHTFGLFEEGVSYDRIQQLEITIFQKVRQRTYVKKDEGWKASNVFKFLDIEEKGLLDFVSFVAVLERIGCKFTDKECKAVFYRHSNGTNVLGYEALCGLFFNMGSGNKDNTNVVYQMSKSAKGNATSHGMTKRLH